MKTTHIKTLSKSIFSAAIAAIILFCTSAPVSASLSATDIPAYRGPFSDVHADHPSYLYVQACSRAGIMNGMGDGSFRPDEPITVKQFSAVLGRAGIPGELVKKAELMVAGAKPGTGSLRRCDAARAAACILQKTRPTRSEIKRFKEEERPGYSASRYGQPIGCCLSTGLMATGRDGLFHGCDELSRADAARLVCVLAGLPLRAAELGSYEPPAKANSRLLVLMYHRVRPDGEPCGDWDASESSFRADLEWLADNGFKTVLPSELASGKVLPERAVMLTFDDGYADNCEIAFPLLEEYGAKAVIALIVKAQDEGKSEFMSWDMAREMQASGLVEFGSHTYGLHMAGSDDVPRGISRAEGEERGDYMDRLRADLELSISRIEEETGVRPCYFAYPYGLTDSWANGIVDELFAVSTVTRAGVSDISKGLERLTRYNANSEYGAAHYALRRYL